LSAPSSIEGEGSACEATAANTVRGVRVPLAKTGEPCPKDFSGGRAWIAVFGVQSSKAPYEKAQKPIHARLTVIGIRVRRASSDGEPSMDEEAKIQSLGR